MKLRASSINPNNRNVQWLFSDDIQEFARCCTQLKSLQLGFSLTDLNTQLACNSLSELYLENTLPYNELDHIIPHVEILKLHCDTITGANLLCSRLSTLCGKLKVRRKFSEFS